ncbi:MAG: aldo/keto reductase [Planctomycetota bacterium]
MERRTLGRTGEKLSVVGLGGIVVMNETPEAGRRIVAQALARGINYFDVGPSYGNAEERLGPALEPYRDSIFLGCKTLERTRNGAMEELRKSLERLRTDRVDLYQLHGVSTMEDVDKATGPGGALEAFVEAREKGLVRFIGFSAHSEEAALALLARFPFDTVLFPWNYVTWHQGKFGRKIFKEARKKGMGILALKALAKTRREEGDTRWPKCWYVPAEGPKEAARVLRWTLSLPVTAAVSASHEELAWWACDAADERTELTREEERELAQWGDGVEPIFPQE